MKQKKTKQFQWYLYIEKKEERSGDMEHEYIFQEQNDAYPANKNKNSQKYLKD